MAAEIESRIVRDQVGIEDTEDAPAFKSLFQLPSGAMTFTRIAIMLLLVGCHHGQPGHQSGQPAVASGTMSVVTASGSAATGGASAGSAAGATNPTIAQLSPHDELKSITVDRVVAGGDDDVMWCVAELTIAKHTQEPGEKESDETDKIRATELG